ncbi:MAG: ribbon-helix-helix domain-containing protein [Methanotrichaceae archaeon]|nr:ribbon-helix-helix domain-containing protein [Methanotrichaceae archaeon]
MIKISISLSVRLPDDLAKNLEDLSQTIDRSKGYIIKKAIEVYLEEYSDYLIALERLNAKDDKIISRNQMRKLLGLHG